MNNINMNKTKRAITTTNSTKTKEQQCKILLLAQCSLFKDCPQHTRGQVECQDFFMWDSLCICIRHDPKSSKNNATQCHLLRS